MAFQNPHFAIAEVLQEACRSGIARCEILDADEIHVNLQLSHGFITSFANGNYAYTVITNRQFEHPVSALDTLISLLAEVINDFELAKSLVSKADLPDQSAIPSNKESAQPVPVKPVRHYPGKALLDAVHEVVEALSELSAAQDAYAQFITDRMHEAGFADFLVTEEAKNARDLAKSLESASLLLAGACAKERHASGHAAG